PFARQRNIRALPHLDQRTVDQPHHRTRTFGRADLISIPDLVPRRNHSYLVTGHGIKRPVHILNGSPDDTLPREDAHGQREPGKRNCGNRSPGHRPPPYRKAATLYRGPPNGVEFAVASALQRVPARDTRVHVVLEQQCASLRQLLPEISRDERLEIFTAAQRVRTEIRRRRSGNRVPDTLARLGNNLVVHLLISNLGKQTIELLILHNLSPKYEPSSLRSCCRVR